MLLAAAAITFLVALGLYFRFWSETLERISTPYMQIHVDFDTFWRSAVAMLRGGDIYDSGARVNNLNPPIWTVLLAPFALLKALAAYRLFVAVSLSIAIVYLAWMADELRLRGGWAAVTMVMLILSSPLLATLALGQIYPVLALGLVAAWILARKEAHLASGTSLGLVVALKPSLLPILLWPAVLRRWRALGAAVVAGAIATLIGVAVLGLDTTFEYLRVLRNEPLTAYWDNASLHAAAIRWFTQNQYAHALAVFPAALPLAYALGIFVVILTAWVVRRSPEAGLWTLVAASLLASPIAWHNYLVLLGPGILFLMARGRIPLGLLLLALEFIPAHWPLLWAGDDTILATLMMTLYMYILVVHWLAFLTFRERAETG